MTARVWALQYSRKGDNSQALALARSIGLPFETKRLRYNQLRAVGRMLGPSFVTLDRGSRAVLGPPWPEAVVAIGRWSVPVARAIKRRSGGRTRIIFLGNPRVASRHFDLIVATRDYLLPSAANVVVAPLPILDPPAFEPCKGAAASHLAALPHPRTLVLIGGSVKYWTLAPDDLGAAIATLAGTANRRGGSIIVSASPRTPDSLVDSARLALAGADHEHVAASRHGGLAELYACADEIFVTGDSMTMVTEAILTGKPVGLLPLQLDSEGRRKLAPSNAQHRSAAKRRDLSRFWSDVWANQLAGTLARPIAVSPGRSTATTAHVATIVRDLIAAPPALAHAGAGTLSAAKSEIVWSVAHLVENVRRSIGALSLAARDRQTPWYAKLVAGTSTILAISPIDLTPDSIPGIGHLDDPILLVVGTSLAVGFVPSSLRLELRRRAALTDRESADHGALAISLLWIMAGLRFARLLF